MTRAVLNCRRCRKTSEWCMQMWRDHKSPCCPRCTHPWIED